MLTQGQQATLEVIKAYILDRHISPTVTEIMAAQQVKSRSFVQRNLQELVEAGLIRLLPDRRRNIELVYEDEQGLPLMGRIAAGEPIEAIAHPEMVNLPELVLGKDRYLLEVKGDSMLGDSICSGDLVICEHTDTVRTGEIAVVLVDNDSATLKRIHHSADKKTISLIPSNPAMLPQEYPAERIQIQGRYIGLLRLGELTRQAS